MHFEKNPTPDIQGLPVTPNYCAMFHAGSEVDYGIKLDSANGEPFGILPGSILCIKRVTHIPYGKIVAAISNGETVVGQMRDGEIVFPGMNRTPGDLQLLGIVVGTVLRF